ncbi:MAG: DUF2267 domain-containing protein [Candidatus Bathyarchaeia archaeon]
MSTNIVALDRAVSNALEIIDQIQDELGWESRDKTYQATKAVLQSIRDRLPTEEVVHFSANLPLIFKGMLMDGYSLKDKPLRIRDLEGFLEYIQANYDASMRDLINPEDAFVTVVGILNRRMGGGEMCKVAANMPEAIRRLFREAGVAMPETSKMPAPA